MFLITKRFPMQIKKIVLGIASITMIVLVVPFFSARAERPAKQVTLYDLGVLQLVAHDLFNVDRRVEVDSENGLLDLSTILDHGDENIVLGGEIRNQENIIVATVAQNYASRYERLISFGWPKERARHFLIRQYHNEVRRAYSHAFGESAPRPKAGEVTLTENVALRTIHDYLPGTILYQGQETPIIDLSFTGLTLSNSELYQMSSELDGEYDAEFRNMVLHFPGFTLEMDLLERDSSFAEQFATEHTFEYFLEFLQDGQYNQDEAVLQNIRSVIAKGLAI